MGCLALAVAGVGFAVGARELAGLGARVTDLVDPPTHVGPDRAAVLRGVRELARLESAALELEQAVAGQRGTDGTWLWVGERILFVARGEVTAGVDLGALAEDGVRVDPDGTVHVRLPDTEIWRVDLDEEASFVARRERGWFGIPDADLETQARREAVRALRQAAEDQGIRDTARRSAETSVRELLVAAGAPAVVFE
ncbi:MAG: DUF4230 domain-containing protein [Alphaproteobacteria bacterium]|nr:DUF4230 domain-containing protein [Alphaproteobacteria bacterium]MCB9691578.1 DUF4230 domain-containing protein [Alphaproteobacteria bacterium]